MAVCAIVMERDLGANKEGDVIHCDEEAANSLCAGKFARLATEDEVNDSKAEEVKPEDNIEPEDKDEGNAEPSPKPVEDSYRAVEDILIKATEKGVEKITANSWNRPTVKQVKEPNKSWTPKGSYVAGSDYVRTGGFKSMGEYALCAIARSKGDFTQQRKFGKWQEARTKATGMSIAGSHVGSDLVPQEWSEELFRLAFQFVPNLLEMCTRFEMRNQIENIPSWVQASATSGITAAITQETTTSQTGTIAASVQPTATVQLNLTKEGVLVNLSDEIMRFNSYHLESYIKQVVPERLRYYINDAIINGNSGYNVNLVGNAATVFVGRQTANQINVTDCMNMEAAMWEGFSAEAVYLATPKTVASLQLMGFPNNGASTQLPVITSGGFGASYLERPQLQLNGRPILKLENVPSLGSTGDLILCHLPSIASGYLDLIADYTKALYFNIAQDSYRFLYYFSTVNPLTVPYTRKDGTYASNIVVLNSGSTGSI